MNLKKRLLFPTALLLLIGAGLLVLRQPRSTSSPPLTKTELESQPIAAKKVQDSLPLPPFVVGERTQKGLEKILASPVTLDRSGPLELARDELFVRQLDGTERVVSFPAASDAASFLKEISRVRDETGVEPELVFYPPKVPRGEFSRRIATREVLITAPDRQAADALAKAAGLEFQSAPEFAPGRFIYTAKNSVEALAFHVQSAPAENTRTTPLLASRVQRMSAYPNDRYFQKQWHLAFQNQLGAEPDTDINVLDLWKYPSLDSSNYNRGQGVTIGIVDDGLEWNHPDLAANMKNDLGRNWNDGDPYDPYPNYWLGDSHGTACAGVAAARGNNNLGVSGVAPEASLVGMRLISGSIGDLEISEAMAWKADQIDIKSNSWGYNIPLYPVGELTEAALEHATSFGRNGKGTIITFSAGNSDLINDRADYSALQNSRFTICVGAVSSRGVKSDYSERGASLVVSAPSNTLFTPGLGIMTTDNKGYFGYNFGTFVPPGFPLDDFLSDANVTMNFGGTSSACPTVSGVIALMLQRNPNLGWRDVQEILMRSAAKVDANDPEWITSNRTDHVTGNKTVEFQFNHKYGAGLVDAGVAVELSGNWTNLGGQLSQSHTPAQTLPVAVPDFDPAAVSVATVTFPVTGPNLRVEHVTLKLSVADVPMKELEVKITSPSGTESIFCEANSGVPFPITDWTFNTVRSWAEDSVGNWTLTVSDRSTGLSGNITLAELTVYGTSNGTRNPPPNINATPSANWVFRGTPVTINATAVDLKADGTAGTVASLALIPPPGNQTITGNLTRTGPSASWTWTPPAAGNYSFTINATDSDGAFRISDPITIRVDSPLIGGWDFETLTANQSTTALTTAIQTSRLYRANFGSNNGTVAALHFDGTNGSSRWEHANGEIWSGFGSTLNLGPGFANSSTSPLGLQLRGGKNLSGNGKSVVFKINMAANRRLRVTYDTAATSGGFTSQVWEYSTNGSTWIPVQTISPPQDEFKTITLNQIAGLNNAANAWLRVRFTGATQVNGTNLLDNIRFNATPQPTPAP